MSVVYTTICDEPGCGRTMDGVADLRGWALLEGGVWNDEERGISYKIPYSHLCPDHIPEWVERLVP